MMPKHVVIVGSAPCAKLTPSSFLADAACEPATSARLSEWIKNSWRDIRRIATVCTGIYGLAPTGLLNGRRVTTHWLFCRDLAARFPNIKVDADALYMRQGRFYTAAGVTAGIDLSLALIEEDFGPQVALAVARELVVYLKRPGGQEQYSQPLKFQAQASSRFADLAPWMVAHLEDDLSVERLAEKVSLCPRRSPAASKMSLGVRRPHLSSDCGWMKPVSDCQKRREQCRRGGPFGRFPGSRQLSPRLRETLWGCAEYVSRKIRSQPG